jgi:phosphoesterase RecJ-like protein
MGMAEALAALERHRSFLVTSHTNPDGDNIASQLALALLLGRLGKQAVIVDQDPVPDRYRFLPGWERIRTSLEPVSATAVAVLDSAAIGRIGTVQDIITPATVELVNIDHHVSNTNFGQVQYVDPDASSTCEMVYRIGKKLFGSFTGPEATCLLAGIMTDTGGFRYECASPTTMRIAAELMEQGARLAEVATSLYAEERAETMQLLGELLAGLKFSAKAPLAWMALSRQQLARHGVAMPETEEFVRYALSVKGVEVGLMLKEHDANLVRLSFRSKGAVDVNRLARLFGGGGHVQAAGAKLAGSLAVVERQVVETIEREIG